MSRIEQYNKELYHYGVKGMKWGVRRYQNEDGSLTAAGRKRAKTLKPTKNDRISDTDNLKISKGTEMYRISTRGSENTDTRYMSYRQNDRNFYKGYWGNILKEKNPSAQLYEQIYKTSGDVFIPSAKTRRKMLSDLMNDSEVIKSLYGDKYSKEVEDNFKNKTQSWSEHERADYLAGALSYKPDILAKYGKMVVDRGFNAVIDDNGRCVGEMPIILFTANTSAIQKGTSKVDQLVENFAKTKYDRIAASKYRSKTAQV